MRTIHIGVMLLAAVMALFTTANCKADALIEVVKAEGKVEVRQQEQPSTTVSSKSILPARNILTTGPTGRAVVRVGNSGFIVVEKNSSIEINQSSASAEFFRHITGMIFYAMNTVRGPRPVEIRTASAIIGIRGTRFLVADLPDRKEIGMRKGIVNVTSPNEEFEIHKKMQEDEFAAFKKEGQDAIDAERRKFNEYKASNEREFVEYKREFKLGADRMVSFDGKRVSEAALSGESKKDMESLETYAAEWLSEVRD